MKDYKKILLASFFISLLLLFTPKVYADEFISVWNNTTALPNQIASHTLVSSNTSLFLLGGANTDIINNNLSSYINPDGTLSSWSKSSIASPNLFWHSSVGKDENVYIIGGSTYPFITNVNTVYLGKINSQNEISSWTFTTPLPKRQYSHHLP